VEVFSIGLKEGKKERKKERKKLEIVIR